MARTSTSVAATVGQSSTNMITPSTTGATASAPSSSRSAGNENLDANGDSLSASRFTITVAAATRDGFASYYSNYGASILVTAPGGGVPGDIVTIDRQGSDGYNKSAGEDGNYTNTFNGTSAATPIVSGVVALMLDANADLGWRDVQNILAASAVHTGSEIGSAHKGRDRKFRVGVQRRATTGTAAACISAATTATAWSMPTMPCGWPKRGDIYRPWR